MPPRKVRKISHDAPDPPTQQPPDPPYRSKLAQYLVFNVMWGFMSSVAAQKIADLAKADGATGGGLIDVAPLGATGRWKQNTFRELVWRLQPSRIMSAFKLIDVPMLATDLKEVVQETTYMLYPHLLLAAIYRYHPAEFLRRLCGNDFENITRFWTSQEQHPLFADHPMHEDTEHNRKYPLRKFGIPIRFHGDGVTSIACGKFGQGLSKLGLGQVVS